MHHAASRSPATRGRRDGADRFGAFVERFAVRFAEAVLLGGVIGAAVAIVAKAAA